MNRKKKGKRKEKEIIKLIPQGPYIFVIIIFDI